MVVAASVTTTASGGIASALASNCYKWRRNRWFGQWSIAGGRLLNDDCGDQEGKKLKKE